MLAHQRKPLLRSEQELLRAGAKSQPTLPLAPFALPIQPEGVTFNMAQSAAWIDGDHFAVGRWDGSLTVFRFSAASNRGPLIAVAACTPSAEGVQMITWVADRLVVTSNDDRSFAVWRPNDAWDRLLLVRRVDYDPLFGDANSGDVLVLDGRIWLAVGHAHGFVSIWCAREGSTTLDFVEAVDVRSATPTNPWELHNVRGIGAVEAPEWPPCFVTGSEDGDLCVITVPDVRLASRRTYNEAARRGINAVAVDGADVLVANCAVGSKDHNLWYFRLDPATLQLRACDAAMLKIDPEIEQAFTFATVWAEDDEGRCFFASTQEGALWMGRLAPHGRLALIGYQRVTSPVGAAMAWANNGNLAFVGYDLYEFNTAPKSQLRNAKPNRLG
jgi:hypothetical protein